MSQRVDCPVCGRNIALTKNGRIHKHARADCKCPYPILCFGVCKSTVCDFETTGELCVSKVYKKRQLELFRKD